jgi:hypothetical protein
VSPSTLLRRINGSDPSPMGPMTLMSLAENAGTAAPKDLMDPQGFIYESELARKSAILARNDNVENG